MSLGAEIRTYPSNGIKTNCAIDISSLFYLMISRSSMGSGDRADFVALKVIIVRGLDEPPGRTIITSAMELREIISNLSVKWYLN